MNRRLFRERYGIARTTVIVVVVVVVVLASGIVIAATLNSLPGSSNSTTPPTASGSTSSSSSQLTEFLSARVSVQILSKHLLVDALGYTNVVGEVKNMGTQNVDFVQLTGTFYNSTNHVTGTDFTFTMLSILMPGEKSPFKITDLAKDLVVDHYSVAVTDASYTTDQPNPNLKVQGTSSNTDQAGYYHALGEVANTGSATAKSVMVIVTFYNGTGGVVDASFAFTSPSDLKAGETGPFDSPTGTNVNMISSFVAQAQEGV